MDFRLATKDSPGNYYKNSYQKSRKKRQVQFFNPKCLVELCPCGKVSPLLHRIRAAEDVSKLLAEKDEEEETDNLK